MSPGAGYGNGGCGAGVIARSNNKPDTGKIIQAGIHVFQHPHLVTVATD